MQVTDLWLPPHAVQVVDAAGSAGSTSGVYSFTTPPAPDSTAPFTIFMAADLGQAFFDGSAEARSLKANGAGGVIKAMNAAAAVEKPRLVTFNGDISCERGIWAWAAFMPV